MFRALERERASMRIQENTGRKGIYILGVFAFTLLSRFCAIGGGGFIDQRYGSVDVDNHWVKEEQKGQPESEESEK
jgi:hypothetical protein